MAEQNHHNQTVRVPLPAGVALAVLAALGANVLLFYVLAAARTRPSLPPMTQAEPVPLSVVELPVPDSEEPDIAPPEIDLVPIATQEMTAMEAQSPPQAESVLTPRLPDGVRAVGPDLPGLAIALPGPSDLRSVPGPTTRTVASPLPLSGVDRPPRRTSGAPPRVPSWARRAHLEGKVTLRFIVTAEGTVAEINVRRIEGDERFGREAMRALATWRFEPATRRGRPVACWCFQTVNFTLDD
jgi:TonB family protein